MTPRTLRVIVRLVDRSMKPRITPTGHVVQALNASTYATPMELEDRQLQ